MCFIEPPRSQIPPPHNRTSSDQYFFSGHIIAILAAILFPVFARAREKARQTSCLNNLKQIGTAWQMYIQDYNEGLPQGVVDDLGGGPRYRVYAALIPYMQNKELWECPSGYLTRTTNAMYYWGEELTLSYAMSMYGSRCPVANVRGNYGLGDGGYYYHDPRTGSSRRGGTIRLADLREPVKDIVFMDAEDNVGQYYRGDQENKIPLLGYPRHNEGINVVYADSHAKWTMPDALQAHNFMYVIGSNNQKYFSNVPSF